MNLLCKPVIFCIFSDIDFYYIVKCSHFVVIANLVCFHVLQQVCEQGVSCFHHGFEFYNVKCFVTICNGMGISLNGLQIEKLVVMLFSSSMMHFKI